MGGRLRPDGAAAHQRGAALLMAMMTVVLAATLAAAGLWRQWRNVEVEASERDRVQAFWLLSGALDWARLILREDARGGGADHLAEPWSVALAESRLSTFLAIDRDHSDSATEVFLSGQISDAQSRMNLMNLVVEGKLSEPDLQAFGRLFSLLGIDAVELERLAANLRLSLAPRLAAGPAEPVALLPRRVEQLRWLGLSEASLQILTPHITLLPTRTTLNLNTAGAQAISASIAGLELDGARRLLAERERAPFMTLGDAARALAAGSAPLDPARVGVATRYFEVRGRLRMEHTVVEERSLVQRDGVEVSTLWRERTALEPGWLGPTTP